MPEVLRMPGEEANTTDAVLVAWHVAVNAPFHAHDTIATVETAKAALDIEAERDGVLLAPLVGEGTEVAVGAPIALLGTPGEQVPDLDAVLTELGAAAKPDHQTPPAVTPNGSVESVRIFVSPLARRLAREAGLRVDDIVGTGPNGRIVRRDVEAAIARQHNQPAPTNAVPINTAPTNNAVPEPDVGSHDVPHSRLRRLIAARLSESKQTAPHFYLRGSARVDALVRLRAELNESSPTRISLNDLLIKAVGQAHLRVPAMNVVWMPDAVRRYSGVDIAVAVDTGAGLVTPVVRDVEQLPVSAVARTMRDYAERARNGTLHQHELEGGTITISNLGMYGTEEFAAVINPPHAAILAVGAVRQEPVVEDGAVVAASVLRLTLSVDHRPVDGTVAAQWMQELIAILRKPIQILA